jgi:archaetidylinositol phosphate synthase
VHSTSAASSSAFSRSRKPVQGTEVLSEGVFRPLAHLVVMPLALLRVPPPLVVAASGAAGLTAAVELAQGNFVFAAALFQLKTVLDNADGQLARLTGRVTAFGRYLDSATDLFVNAALFAALGWESGRPAAALIGFVALTAVLSVNFNIDRLSRAEHAGPSGREERGGRATRLLRHAYAVLYGWQDRAVERYVERRLLGRGPAERLAYHDRATVSVLANLGLSTQLAIFGALTAFGQPLAFIWLLLGTVAVVAALALRREVRPRGVVSARQEAT